MGGSEWSPLCVLETRAEAEAARARLGPDPRDRHADPAVVVAVVRRSRWPVGALLVDQAVAAGVGNIFRAELLLRRGIDPATPGGALHERVVRGLWQENVALKRTGEGLGRMVSTHPADRPGVAEGVGVVRARPPARLVYRRRGLPCRRCGRPAAGGELDARGSTGARAARADREPARAPSRPSLALPPRRVPSCGLPAASSPHFGFRSPVLRLGT